jgi:hypothetical protein
MDERAIRKAVKLVLYLGIAMFSLVVVQFISLRSHTYFGLPAVLYVQNGDLIPDENDLRYTEPRAAGTFGEPSYLGGVCLGLIVAISPRLADLREARVVGAVMFTICLVCQTLLGVMANAVYLGYCVVSRMRSSGAALLSLALAAFIGVGALGTENPFSTRVSAVTAGHDSSAMDRIVDPLIILPGALSKHPLGVPGRILFGEDMYAPEVDKEMFAVSHNGLVNFALNYGYVGVGAVFVLMLCAKRGEIRVFILLLSMQNGMLLGFDKFYIIAVCVMLFNSLGGERMSTDAAL